MCPHGGGLAGGHALVAYFLMLISLRSFARSTARGYRRARNLRGWDIADERTRPARHHGVRSLTLGSAQQIGLTWRCDAVIDDVAPSPCRPSGHRVLDALTPSLCERARWRCRCRWFREAAQLTSPWGFDLDAETLDVGVASARTSLLPSPRCRPILLHRRAPGWLGEGAVRARAWRCRSGQHNGKAHQAPDLGQDRRELTGAQGFGECESNLRSSA